MPQGRRTRKIAATLALLVCSLLLSGCRHPPPAAPPPPPKPAPAPPAPPRDGIAENTTVVATLVRSIGSRLCQDGEPFKARLTSPIQAESGERVAVSGAMVTGTVVSRSEGLSLRFESVETLKGPVAVRARLLDFAPNLSMEITNLDRDAGGADVRICAAVGIQRGKRRAPQQPTGMAQCRGTVLLRNGTKLRLQLSQVRTSK